MKYGNLYATAGIATDMEQDRQFAAEVLEAFRRYQLGDWGVVCPEASCHAAVLQVFSWTFWWPSAVCSLWPLSNVC